jgi:hypothetical protein
MGRAAALCRHSRPPQDMWPDLVTVTVSVDSNLWLSSNVPSCILRSLCDRGAMSFLVPVQLCLVGLANDVKLVANTEPFLGVIRKVEILGALVDMSLSDRHGVNHPMRLVIWQRSHSASPN